RRAPLPGAPGHEPGFGAHRDDVSPRALAELHRMLAVPFSELLWLALAIVVGGVVTGILAGLFGIGGGAIIVPVLYDVFRIIGVSGDVRIQLCVGTSLAIIGPTTIRSYRAHQAKGAVLHDVVRAWAVPAVVGVGIGSIIAAFAPSGVFKLAFVAVATFVGA